MNHINNLGKIIRQIYAKTNLKRIEVLVEKSFEIIEKLENENVDEKYFRKEILEKLKRDEINIYDFKDTYIKNCYLYVNLTGFLALPLFGYPFKKFSEPLEKFIFLNSKNERHVFVHADGWDQKYRYSLGVALLRIK